MTHTALEVLGEPSWRHTLQAVRLMAYPATATRPYGLLITAGRVQGLVGERDLILCLPGAWSLDVQDPNRAWWWTLRLLSDLRSRTVPLGSIVAASSSTPYYPESPFCACLLVEAFAPEDVSLAGWGSYAQVLLLTKDEQDYGAYCGWLTLYAQSIARSSNLHIIHPQRGSFVTLKELPTSAASSPGLIPISDHMLKLVQPELIGRISLSGPLSATFGTASTQHWRNQLRTNAACGLLDLAVVVRLEPLVVAVRSLELDCVALLGFPGELGEALRAKHGLVRGSLTSVVNTYFGPGAMEQADITPGPRSRGAWHGFWPLLSIAICDDQVALKRALSHLDQKDSALLLRQAEDFVQTKGWLVRSGAPMRAILPAMPLHQLDVDRKDSRPESEHPSAIAPQAKKQPKDPSWRSVGWLIWVGIVILGALHNCTGGH